MFVNRSSFSHLLLFSSPFNVKEDDEVDNLELKLDVKPKSKRVYQSPPPEVGLKISRSLKVCFWSILYVHETVAVGPFIYCL